MDSSRLNSAITHDFQPRAFLHPVEVVEKMKCEQNALCQLE